jgi:aldehyde:ferredoxin oxidoreductase
MPVAWDHLGGCGLSARILLEELGPTIDTCDEGSKLVMAPGLLARYKLSNCDRISIGGKSPLTGGIKEANAGGRTARSLVQLGIRALILEGNP